MRTPRPHGAFTPRRHTRSTLVTKGRVHHEYTNEEGGCRRRDRQPGGCGCCSPDHGTECLGTKCLGTRRLGAMRRRHDGDVGQLELSGDRGSGVLDERIAVRGCDGERDVSGRWRARGELGKSLQDECRDGRSRVPRGAVRQSRLDVPTHSSGAMTRTPALCRTGSAPVETKQRNTRASRPSARPSPFWGMGLHILALP
jgi:hypothetical protein